MADTIKVLLTDHPSVTWQPREDITTYELAQATPVIVAHMHHGTPREAARAVDDLPPEVRRHFKVENESRTLDEANKG